MKYKKIFVAGHAGMVGSAVLNYLKSIGCEKILTKTRNELDRTKQDQVHKFFGRERPEIVIICAAKVGGILANNTYRADFIYQNLQIATNLIHASHIYNVHKLINLGSSCIYPRDSEIPIKEEYLLTDILEKTNEPYAIAKIAGIKMCESYNFQYKTNYKCLMPCNLYGPNDNYDLKTSHFFPALIVKALAAKKNKKNQLILWGSGRPKRELMYVDDLADACIYFLNKKTKDSLINIGMGHDKSIFEYAKFILKKINFKCKIILDKSKPDGTQRKIIDNSIALSYGWKPKINLDEGFDLTLKSYLSKSRK